MSLITQLKSRARQLKADVFALYLATRHPDTPWYAKVFLLTIVAYTLSPIDLIPDFIPVLGLLDEIVLLPLAIVLATKMVPAAVMEECRARTLNSGISTRAGRIAAAIIVLVWITLIVIAGMWAYSAFGRGPEVGLRHRFETLPDRT